MLNFWGHFNRKIGTEDVKTEKELLSFFLTLDRRLSEEEEESNDDS